MKPESRRVWRWIAAGSVVVFLVFCAIRASRLHPVIALPPRVVATNQLQRTSKAGVQPPLAFDILGGLKAVITNKPELLSDMPQPNSHVVALARDLQGNIWVGTEGDGVFRYDPDAEPESQWSQFTTNNGLGDNNTYPIACDQRGAYSVAPRAASTPCVVTSTGWIGPYTEAARSAEEAIHLAPNSPDGFRLRALALSRTATKEHGSERNRLAHEAETSAARESAWPRGTRTATCVWPKLFVSSGT